MGVGPCGEGEEKARQPPGVHRALEMPWPSGDRCRWGISARRVAPLMVRALLLYGMVPIAQLDGTVLAQGALRDFEIEQHIREVLVMSDVVFPIVGHLEKRPVIGFIDLVNVTCLSSLFTIPSGFVMDFGGREL